MRAIALLAAVAIVASPVAAAPRAPRGFAATADRFVAAARAEKVAGGSLAFMERGQIVASRTFGDADIDTHQPIDRDTIFHWASITKTFTAIAIMQLAERRLISLDDPIVKYVPEFAAVHNPYGPIEQVTIRTLLTHSSGLRDPTWPWNPDGASEAPDWQPEGTVQWREVMAMMPYTGLAFAPGSQYSYSNPGFSLLGLVIEKVTGDDVEAYIDKNVLAPLGMTRSYFDVTPYHLQRFRGNNYTIGKKGRIANGHDFDTGATVANGGLNAPIGDMTRYFAFLAGFGDAALYDRILPRQTLLAMFKPLNKVDYDPTIDERMGTGFFTIDAKGADGRIRHYIGHTGSQWGYRAFFYIDAETGATAVMAVNTSTEGKGRPLVFDTRRDFFEHVFPYVGNGR